MSASVHYEPRFDQTAAESLRAEITELSAYIYAATCRLLELIRAFDENRYWEEQGFVSCAAWLNFHCGLGPNAARERLRVAHALPGLPKIREAFSEGKLSFSKVRAMTRVANAENEEFLLMTATHGTASQLERLVAGYRRARKFDEPGFAFGLYEKRELSWHYDDDGCVVIKATLPPDQGEVVLKALDKATDLCGVSAETSDEDKISIAARRADALADIAETYLGNSDYSGSTADRYQVVIHTRLDDNFIENGPDVSAETSERITCDCSKVEITECEHGEPLSIGRKSRIIPPAVRRMLWARDGGCRFPGCTHDRFCDGHHVEHWENGGETSLDNLVLLCRHHHRLVHEGGFACRKSDDGEIWFEDRRGERLEEQPGHGSTTLEEAMAWMYRKYQDRDIDSESCTSKYYAGETIDYDYAVSVMFGNPP